MPSTNPDLPTPNAERALDRALRDTFPASDPPAATSFTPPIYGTAANEEELLSVWLVLAAACAEKPVEQWRTCGQGRWVSANVPALCAALSPAGALLEALVNHHLSETAGEWRLVSLKLPASALLRLDTPHEQWRERPYRNDVRLCGDRWALEQQSLALRVPSSLCPGEYSVLLNTLHPDFARLQRGTNEELPVDSRLRRG